MNSSILNTAISNGIEVNYVNVKENTVTKFNNTPFADSKLNALAILSHTKKNDGGTFIYQKPINGKDAGFVPYHGDGYAVGGYQDTVKIPFAYDSATQDAIAHFIERIPGTIDGDRHYLVGTWVSDGILYIDAVQIWADFDAAMDQAAKNGEIAIFGLGDVEFDGETVLGEWKKVDDRWFPPAPQEVESEKTVTVDLDDVISLLESKRDSFLRNAEAFSDPGDEETYSPSLALQFQNYARAVDIHLIPGITKTFRRTP